MTTEQKIAAATARIKELETLIKLWKNERRTKRLHI